MTTPTRATQIVDTLPTLYFQDPVTRHVVDAIAGRLAVAQTDLEEVLHAHWVDTADASPAPVLVERPLDLAAIGALVPLVPFPDEEQATRSADAVVVDSTTILDGPPGEPLTFARLEVGQRVSVGGVRQANGSVLATRLALGKALSGGPFGVTLNGLIARITAPSATAPLGSLVVFDGRSGAEMFRQRLSLTAQVFLDGVGTAPAVLQMVAATMGWGRLIGNFADWRAPWAPRNPVFQALAEGGPAAIRLRELPLVAATTPAPQHVKSGARWIETATSAFVVDPNVEITALDLPVLIPTLVSLDTQVAIATLVSLDTLKLVQGNLVQQAVSLHIDGQPDGTLRASLLERRLPDGEVVETDVSDRIRVRSPGLRVDRPGATATFAGGSDGRLATLVVSDSHRALRLSARADGIWGNLIQVRHASSGSVELRFSAGDGNPAYVEQATLDDLLAGLSRLVTAEEYTFTIPEGPSHWLYFDHAAPAMFDATQWDLTVFDEPVGSDVDEAFADFPAKGVYDYAAFDRTTMPQEFLRAFRFDQPTSRFDDASYNETPEQVAVLLGWHEGQRATIRIDVPLATPAERSRLAVLPDMIRQVKPAGVKLVLGQPLLDAQPLGEVQPRVRPLMSEEITLGEALHARLTIRLTESAPTLADTIVGTTDASHWNDAIFDSRG